MRPEYMAERWTFSRMRRRVSGVVKAIWQEICGWTIFFVRKLKGVGSTSPGCSSNVSHLIVRPSRRGGVPVLRRHGRRPSERRASDVPSQDRDATAPRWADDQVGDV